MMELKQQRLRGVKIGVILTGSHCTINDVIPEIKHLIDEGADVLPVFSYTVDNTDNRFYRVEDLKKTITDLTDHEIINTIVGAEPIGPQKLLDIVVVAPATGNTIAKMAHGIADTPALMAIKAQLRNQRPVVIAVSSNDALGVNASNIGLLLNMKNIFFVPFRQDNPAEKANSVVACMSLITDTVINALQGRQIQPLLLGPA
ncbi:MAG: dipicolinate synthase subunit B [Syntrophomonadaceae bacterium]|jgi:dipicolinate synthase subunit B|nr:dipicolinate synthase subunit B [Bacillota bacterium]